MQYLRRAFHQESSHFTGEEWVEFPEIHVFDYPEYDFRKRILPAVVLMNAVGQTTDLAFDQELGTFTDEATQYGDDPAQQYLVIGGQSSFTLNVLCGAGQEPLQQHLTDAVAMYLLLGRYTAFLSSRTVLLDQVAFLGGGRVTTEPDQEPVFEGRLSARISADWRVTYPVSTITRIDVDPESVF